LKLQSRTKLKKGFITENGFFVGFLPVLFVFQVDEFRVEDHFSMQDLVEEYFPSFVPSIRSLFCHA